MSRVHNDPYQSYADKLARPAPLSGPMVTRGEARLVYFQIVQRMHSASSLADLNDYLASVEGELRQFQKELPHLWNGDGEDFAGLSQEMLDQIERVKSLDSQVATATI